MGSQDLPTVILSQRRRQAALIAATVCLVTAIILFISTKSFGEQPGYIFLICGAIMFEYAIRDFQKSHSSQIVFRLEKFVSPCGTGANGRAFFVGLIMPRHFLETVGPLVLGVTFVGEFLAQVSILLVEDYGVSELFIVVCLSNVYETGAKQTRGSCIFFALCFARKFVLPRRSIQPVPLDLDNLERRLEIVNDEVRAAREFGQVTKLETVIEELTNVIGDIGKAKGGRQ